MDFHHCMGYFRLYGQALQVTIASLTNSATED
jgi:hypothetical protein